ncbi:MAG: hypothetical protein LAO31_08310 [Acidobacteriia bacterium]|nr:hypothetical protein [Terriglobia bacterium]
MKNKIGFTLLIVLGIAMGALVVRAQSTPPSSDTVLGGYTVTQDAELGVRFLGRDGNENKYRSDLNYGRGFRLFNYDFLARSKDGHGGFFDLFRVTALGWGGDPNEFLRVDVEKNKWYRFDATFRQFDYFNNLTNLALNQHLADNSRKFDDFNLALFPDNQHFKFYVGYTFDKSSGNATTTYDYQRDEFPIQSKVRSVANDWRVGFDAKVWVFDLSFLQGYRIFKDDTTYVVPSLNVGNNPTNTSVINFLTRDVPSRTHMPFTRFSAHTLIKKKLDFTGRFIYSTGTTTYNFAEAVKGVDASNNNILLDLFNGPGSARRPNGIGDLGASFFATDRLTISETFRVNTFRISGGSNVFESLFRTRTTAFGTTTLPPTFISSLIFELVGYRLFSNYIEGDYKFSPKFSGHVGYRYTSRRVELGTSIQPPLGTALDTDTQFNHTNSVVVGFKARPASIWTVYFDFERGTADNVFTRLSNYNYTNFRVRTSVKPTKTLTFNASLVTRDNNNPALTQGGQNFGVDAKGRIFSASADFSPNSKFTFTSGYTYNRLTSDSSIIFFLGGIQTTGTSLYFLRDHYFFFNSHVQLHPRVGLFFGYRIEKDTGQGDQVASSPSQLISSYPLQFHSPEVRLTFKLLEHLDWNAGFQRYDYKEKFLNNQNYRANLPYTSLRLYF